MTPLEHAVAVLSKAATERGSESMLTFMPDGGALILVGAKESDVTGMLVSAIAEIENRRSSGGES